MAATTLAAIIVRVQTVCEGGGLLLQKATDEFSFDRQPNRVVNTVYRVEDGGHVESTSLTNDNEARMDEVAVWLARKATPDAAAERATLEATILTLERKLIADGPSNSYHARLDSREVEREGDILTARVGFLVDYDVSIATT